MNSLPENLQLKNMDCVDLMREMPDKHFDIAIVDPPYGLGDKLISGGTWAAKLTSKDSKWDIAPDASYFNELFRVSKNQIIWGGQLLQSSSDARFHYLGQKTYRQLDNGDG